MTLTAFLTIEVSVPVLRFASSARALNRPSPKKSAWLRSPPPVKSQYHSSKPEYSGMDAVEPPPDFQPSTARADEPNDGSAVASCAAPITGAPSFHFISNALANLRRPFGPHTRRTKPRTN